MGIIETSSGQLGEVRLEIEKMRDLTDRPWGVNVAQLFIRDLSIIDFIVDNGVRFVTTSAGDPAVLVPKLKAAGITVFHVVPSLRGARKAIAAGVDGLVVEGIEGGGFKNPDGASSMVLLPLIAAEVDVPIVAAGGIADGVSMAAALVLGAEGVQMGTRMLDCGGVAGARQLEAGGDRGGRDRHRDRQPLREAGHADVAHRALRGRRA